MKQFLFIGIVVSYFFCACTKKNNGANTTSSSNQVSINGSIYKTVIIGNQTWTSSNYNGPGGVNYGDTSLNTPLFGKLYTYTEAEAISLPTGWRLPTNADFNAFLVSLNASYGYLSGTSALSLISTTPWYVGPGTNSTGFNAVAAGFFYSRPNHYGFNGIGVDAEFLTSSVDNSGYHMTLVISYLTPNDPHVYVSTPLPAINDRGSVRFVKDN